MNDIPRPRRPLIDLGCESGEDAEWSKAVLPKIRAEYKIDRVLYKYNCVHATSETLPEHIKEQLLKGGKSE